MKRRGLLVEALDLAFKNAPDAPCGCDSCATLSQPDPVGLKESLRAAALQERRGALAMDAVEKFTRWLSGGRVQEPPMPKFCDPDGKRLGYFTPRDPETIYVARGQTDEELLRTLGHEISHFLQYKLTPWLPDNEHIACTEGEHVLRQYLDQDQRGTEADFAAALVEKQRTKDLVLIASASLREATKPRQVEARLAALQEAEEVHRQAGEVALKCEQCRDALRRVAALRSATS
jgi:hypothetical protein